jgi:hypothetical protein
VSALAIALAFAWLPALAVLGGKGRLAVRHFEWLPNGEWHLERSDGRREIGMLAGATTALGPWILFAWTVGSGAWYPLSRRYALIGVSQVSPTTFRTLKGRLALEGGRHSDGSRALREPVAP